MMQFLQFLGAGRGAAVGGAVLLSSVGGAWAQGKPSAPPSRNLTFSMTARVFYKDGAAAPTPAQTINAQVYLSGKRARLDTTISGRPMRLLFTPPWGYRLLPAAKIGQKFRASSLPPLAALLPGSQGFSPDPNAIRTALVRGGARKTGVATVAGVAVDVYSSDRFRNRPDKVKAFLRRSDALPLRVEIKSKNFEATASWRDYRRPRSISAATFAVPAGFRIREAAPQSALSSGF
jgi:hypothetical protein